MVMTIVSLNIGRPQILMRGDKRVSSAINRKSVVGPVELTEAGFVGDRVSNQEVHGGQDKAVCCYPSEHYPFWVERLGVELAYPSFGENLTTQGLLETEVRIGDVYRIGAAELQVSQPRRPCSKLAMKHNQPKMIMWVNETGYSGFYFRVLNPGSIAAGDAIERIERPGMTETVDSVFRAGLRK